jgi:hypothetical protein
MQAHYPFQPQQFDDGPDVEARLDPPEVEDPLDPRVVESRIRLRDQTPETHPAVEARHDPRAVEWHQFHIPMDPDPLRPPVQQGPGPRCPFDLKLLRSSEWCLGMCPSHVQDGYDLRESCIRHWRRSGAD